MNGPQMRPDEPGQREDVSPLLVGRNALLALMERQNRLIARLTQENAELRVRAETLVWALARVREHGAASPEVSLPSLGVTVVESVLPAPALEPPRVHELRPGRPKMYFTKAKRRQSWDQPGSPLTPRRCLDCGVIFDPRHHQQFRCRMHPCKSSMEK